MGHASSHTTERYTHIADSLKRDAVNQIGFKEAPKLPEEDVLRLTTGRAYSEPPVNIEGKGVYRHE